MKKIFSIIFFILLLALVPVGIWQHDNIAGFIQSKVNADSSLADEQPTENPIEQPIEKPENKEPVSLSSGLYNWNNSQLMSWEDLKDNGYLSVDNGVLKSNSSVSSDVAGHLVIDDEVTSIGKINNLSSLYGVTIPNTVTSIGEQAFMGLNIVNLVIPDSVISIGESAFEATKIKEINIPASVEDIGVCAFYGCKYLSTVTGLEGVAEIPSFCFHSCEKLKNIDIPANVLIGGVAFEHCSSLEKITLDNVTLYGSAFLDCVSLKDVLFINGLSLIGDGVFEGCTSLEKIVLPEGLKSISDECFKNCSSLKEIILPSTITFISSEAFVGCNNLLSIFLPKSLIRFLTFSYEILISGNPFEHVTSLFFETDVTGYSCWTGSPFTSIEILQEGNTIKFGYTYEQYLAEIQDN